MILLVSSTLPKIQTDFILSIVFRPDMTYNVFSGTLNPTQSLLYVKCGCVCLYLTFVYFCVAVHLS